jgi:hypothetical protein
MNAMRNLLFPVYALPILFGIGCASPEPPAPAPEKAEPTNAELAERGKYLVGIMGCHDCHSPKLMGPQGPYPDPARLLSGHPANEALPPLDPKANPGWAQLTMGLTAAHGPWGTSFAANLTSDATGIGNWTEEQFIRAVKKGLYKGLEGSRPLLPPMPWQNFANIQDDDLHAIFTYLKSTAPVENVVPSPIPPAQD